MAVPLLASATPLPLSPPRLFLHRRAVGGAYLFIRRFPPVSPPLLRLLDARGPSVACSSQYPTDFLTDVETPEALSSLDTVVGELESNHLSTWQQMKEIAKFAGPATGIWICGPLMSLIDTMVIGQGSSLELAALGPATVFCDNLSYIFMFLSIATSNMVATSVAKKDKVLAQSQISMLLFVAFASGLGMLLFTKFIGFQMLAAFSGSTNVHLVTSANTYIQIRGLAWPAILVGMVAQSASLGMKNSWGPLKALAVASAVNGLGDIFLCSICGYGIAGAAWATMFSQARLLLKSLVIIGAITGVILGIIGTTFPWSLPYLFTADHTVIGEMHQILIPYFIALMITPSTHSLEGTLLAGRDLSFLSISMTGCFCFAGLLLASSRGFGLPGCWWSLAVFQWSRFSIALQRLTSPHGMLYNENFQKQELVKLKGV